MLSATSPLEKRINDDTDNTQGISGNPCTLDGYNDASGRPVKRSQVWESEPETNTMNCDESNDGFILVANKKKKLNRATSETVQPPCTAQPARRRVPTQVFRLTFPRGMSPRDRAIWLADVANKHRNLSVQPKLAASSIIAVTEDKDTFKFLTEVGHPYQGNTIRLTEITAQTQQTKVIIRNYPSFLPISYVEDHPSILWARRNTQPGTEEPKNQVIAMWKGELHETMQLPGVRPCKVERYIGKPTFCGRCQKWGHRAWQCDGRIKCGFCSEAHDSAICKEKITKGERVIPKCPNCFEEHNAWSIKCPMRPGTRHPRDQITTIVPPPAVPQVAAFPPLPNGVWSESPLPPPPQQAPNPPLLPWTQPPDIATPPTVPTGTWSRSGLPPSLSPQPQRATKRPLPSSQPASPPGLPTRYPLTHTETAPLPSAANTVDEEVKALREEVKQLKISQAALQQETRDLRTALTALVENEVANMMAMLSQMLQAVNGTGHQQHAQPIGEENDMEMDAPSTQKAALETQQHEIPLVPQRQVRRERNQQDQIAEPRAETGQLTDGMTLPPPLPSRQGTPEGRPQQVHGDARQCS